MVQSFDGCFILFYRSHSYRGLLEKQGRTHKWCTLMGPHTWLCKSRTTSTNIHSATMWGYRMLSRRPARGDERLGKVASEGQGYPCYQHDMMMIWFKYSYLILIIYIPLWGFKKLFQFDNKNVFQCSYMVSNIFYLISIIDSQLCGCK